jgi:Raf kinase inhibitor-like YbhB/YbcL family protein
MKILRNSLLAIVVLVAAALAVILWRASNARTADDEFHSGLTRSMTMRSETFSGGGNIPAQFTCTGAGVSPPIWWGDAPPLTASFVLIAVDWDVPSPAFRLFGFTHWTLFDIPASVMQLASGASVKQLSDLGAKSGLNSGRTIGFTPPCPPMGVHKYIFRIYALDVPQLQPDGTDRVSLIDAMKGHVLGYGELSAFYSK